MANVDPRFSEGAVRFASRGTSSRIRSDKIIAATNLGLACAQPLAAYVTQLSGRGVSEGERARAVDGPVSPAPGAFVIWLPLFVTSIAHGVYVARSEERLPSSRVAWLMSAAYSCNSLWSLQAQLRGLGWASVGLIAVGATSACTALIRAERASERPNESRVAAYAIAPLAGWLTLATFANVEATLNETRGRPRKLQETQRSLALLSGAVTVASAVATASRGNRLYTAAVAWGLGGVVARNLRARNPAVATAASIALGAALATTFFGRRWLGGRNPRERKGGAVVATSRPT